MRIPGFPRHCIVIDIRVNHDGLPGKDIDGLFIHQNGVFTGNTRLRILAGWGMTPKNKFLF